jgi:hypothetical protein
MYKVVKNIFFLVFFVLISFVSKAQTDSSAKEAVGITGESIYHKYIIEIIGNKKDTIGVFDSAAVELPLKSDYYSIRVHRVNFKGELKEYRIKGFNMVVNLSNDSNYTQQFVNRYIEDPLLSYFKSGKIGSVISVGDIEIIDESDKIRNVGSYQLLYR